MIVTCTNCTARLQLDDAKLPARPFTVRCPKCQFIINAQPPAASADGSAMSVAADLPPALRGQRDPKPAAAPAFPVESGVEMPDKVQPMRAAAGGEQDLMRMLVTLLQRGMGEGLAPKQASGRRWGHRRALVCTAYQHRETLARLLSQNQYEVFVADDTMQAIERMREDQMDVVLLDPEFDAIEQGAAFITREINQLRPTERRRVLFVQMLGSVRTADPHAAFLNHVNLVVNPTDIEDLPHVMERSFRDLNELYRDFNQALNLSDL